MYKETGNDFTGDKVQGVYRLSDNAYIPFDPANVDYQAYLVWISEGNVPEPAEI